MEDNSFKVGQEVFIVETQKPSFVSIGYYPVEWPWEVIELGPRFVTYRSIRHIHEVRTSAFKANEVFGTFEEVKEECIKRNKEVIAMCMDEDPLGTRLHLLQKASYRISEDQEMSLCVQLDGLLKEFE